MDSLCVMEREFFYFAKTALKQDWIHMDMPYVHVLQWLIGKVGNDHAILGYG